MFSLFLFSLFFFCLKHRSPRMDIESKEAQKVISADAAATGTLDLEFRSLNRVPKYVWGLTALVDVSFDNNDISLLDIPKGSLPNLKRFSIRHNELEKIPHFFSNVGPQFELLDVRDNRIEELPEALSVLLNKPELVIELEMEHYGNHYKYSDSRGTRCVDPNWGGWHGKTPKTGDTIRLERWGRGHWPRISEFQVSVDYEEKPGFRLRYEGNPAEEVLRESLGMSEGEAWDAEKVRKYLDAKMRAARRQSYKEKEKEVPPDWAELGKQRKEQQLERERDKKQKDKAVRRDTSHRARLKLMESGE